MNPIEGLENMNIQPCGRALMEEAVGEELLLALEPGQGTAGLGHVCSRCRLSGHKQEDCLEDVGDNAAVDNEGGAQRGGVQDGRGVRARNHRGRGGGGRDGGGRGGRGGGSASANRGRSGGNRGRARH